MKKYDKKSFIERANLVHNFKYSYDRLEYFNSKEKVCIICPEHGEFWQLPSAHLRGDGCPMCGNNSRGVGKRSNLNEFISKARRKHGDKYDYSNVVYINSNTPVDIICPIHGVFKQTPTSHLNCGGCPKCAGKGLCNEEIISKFREVHGDKYDYSKVRYEKSDKKVIIICPEHGEFLQAPSKHLIGRGCPKCAIEKRAESNKMCTDEFIKAAISVHGDIYDYSNVKYNNTSEKVAIECPKHGIFWQRPYDHLGGHGCPKCGIIESFHEDEISEWISNRIGKENVVNNDRTVLNGREIDIYIPMMNIGIEYDGLKWHCMKDRNYHYNKTIDARKNGVSLIHIFEDEYLKNKEIVLSKIGHILGICDNLEKIDGRKCKIREISHNIANKFLKLNHIQGSGKSNISLGCYYGNILVGVMTFLDKKKGKWELNRFATDINYICRGIGGKLFKYFIDNYNPIEIKTFADRRWTISEDNNLYTRLGFTLDGYVKPDYEYVRINKPIERIHKSNFRKNKLKKKYKEIDYTLTESKIMHNLGYGKIWNCGLIRYVWRKK